MPCHGLSGTVFHLVSGAGTLSKLSSASAHSTCGGELTRTQRLSIVPVIHKVQHTIQEGVQIACACHLVANGGSYEDGVRYGPL